MRISDWSSDVCSSDLQRDRPKPARQRGGAGLARRVRGRGGNLRHRPPYRRLRDDRQEVPSPAIRGNSWSRQVRLDRGKSMPHRARRILTALLLSIAAPSMAAAEPSPAEPSPYAALAGAEARVAAIGFRRSEEHTSELQSLMRISYAVFCLKKKNQQTTLDTNHTTSSPSHQVLQI